MKKILFLLLSVLLTNGLAAQRPEVNGPTWEAQTQHALDSIIANDPLLKTSQLGLFIYDLTADSIFYGHQHRQTMRPASTMKLVTAITALDALHNDYQLKTILSYSGEIIDSTLTGSLYCVGGMDPLFDSQNLREFALAVKGLGIDTLRGSIVTDHSMKDADEWGEGWCWDDDNPTLSPLLVNRSSNFADQMIAELLEVGVFVDSVTTFEDHPPLDAIPLCTAIHTLEEVLEPMMKDSDNLFAECVYYQLGAANYYHPVRADHARSMERQLLSRLGLDTDNYRLADGSGLSLYNYISAEVLVTLLRHAWSVPDIYRCLYHSLPIAGKDGTLKKRMLRTIAQDNVRAKTGTLTGIISLAGYLTAGNGHQFCFAIINQSALNKKEARAFQDRICITLCKKNGRTETKKSKPVYKRPAKTVQKEKSHKQRRSKRRRR